jgi:hypothetical protein
MTTYTTDDRIAAQQDNLAEHIVRAKRLLNEIELLAACPANTDKVKAIQVCNKAIDEFKAMITDIERIKE